MHSAVRMRTALIVVRGARCAEFDVLVVVDAEIVRFPAVAAQSVRGRGTQRSADLSDRRPEWQA